MTIVQFFFSSKALESILTRKQRELCRTFLIKSSNQNFALDEKFNQNSTQCLSSKASN